MFKSAFPVKRLATDAVLTALFFALSLFSVPLFGLKLTLDSLPCILAALLYGPIDGFLTAFLGMFLQQMLQYGFTVTTPLWMLAPALRGLIVGFSVPLVRRLQGSAKYGAYFGFCVLAGLIVSAGNTAVLYLDSKLFGYYTFALVFGVAAVRFATGALCSVGTAALALPILQALKRAGLSDCRVFE